MQVIKRENSYLCLLTMFYSTENVVEILLLAQLLREGDVALTLNKMSITRGLSCAVNPYGGIIAH